LVVERSGVAPDDAFTTLSVPWRRATIASRTTLQRKRGWGADEPILLEE
jgi:hypothetical protein